MVIDARARIQTAVCIRLHPPSGQDTPPPGGFLEPVRKAPPLTRVSVTPPEPCLAHEATPGLIIPGQMRPALHTLGGSVQWERRAAAPASASPGPPADLPCVSLARRFATLQLLNLRGQRNGSRRPEAQRAQCQPGSAPELTCGQGAPSEVSKVLLLHGPALGGQSSL